MKCNDVNGLLEDYLSGRLVQSTASHIEGHLASCSHCSQLLLVEDQELDNLLYSSWHLTSPSAGFTDKVMQQVGSEKRVSWLWLVVMGLGYMSLWALAVASIIVCRHFTWVMELASHMVSLMRSMAHVLRVIAEAVGHYNISTIGLVFIFGSATVIFLGIGFISKGDFAK
ncbi:MAG: zf-HC2 domain-containing protein [Peptococcaceae bacterium]|nr:zf-HC2 domain-containing protein [Peptococcaceae bacterium]